MTLQSCPFKDSEKTQASCLDTVDIEFKGFRDQEEAIEATLEPIGGPAHESDPAPPAGSSETPIQARIPQKLQLDCSYSSWQVHQFLHQLCLGTTSFPQLNEVHLTEPQGLGNWNL